MGCRAEGMSRNWKVAQMGCRATGMSRKWNIAQLKCRATEVSRNWNVAQLGCRATEMSRNWNVAQLGGRAIEMSRRWDVALEKSRANGISPDILGDLSMWLESTTVLKLTNSRNRVVSAQVLPTPRIRLEIRHSHYAKQINQCSLDFKKKWANVNFASFVMSCHL